MKTNEVEQRLRQTFEAAAVLDKVPASEAAGRPPRRRGPYSVRRWLPPLLAAAVVVGAATIAYAVTGTGGSGQHSPVPADRGGSTKSTESLRGGLLAPPPSFYVAHALQTTGAPGAIQVRDTATGAVLRTLGTVYDPYPMNGFVLSPDKSTLYYTALNEPAQTIEIKAIPVTGGRPQVIATGSQPQPSPKGTELAYLPAGAALRSTGAVAVMDLATHAVRTITLPDTQLGRQPTNLVWVSSAELVVRATRTTGATDCRPDERCPAPTTVGEAYSIDTSGPALAAHQLPELRTGPHWSALTLLTGRSPTEVYALAGSSLYLLNPLTGTVTDQLATPKGYEPVSVDARSHDVLLLASDGGRAAFWNPDTPSAPTLLGTGVSEVTW